MSPAHLDRRAFFRTATAIGATAALGTSATRAFANPSDGSDSFSYEVTRSLPEWIRHLDQEAFSVMRLSLTEKPKSSPLWQETRDGTYFCKGCDLPLYDNTYKEVLDIGWVFFRHSLTNAVLTGIDDGPRPNAEESMMVTGAQAVIEVHCRRCGSHLGHLVSIKGKPMHCINGVAMRFEPTAA